MSTAGKFTRIAKLGEGTYGAVYKAEARDSRQIYALKRMTIPGDEEGVPATTIREICLLKELRHRHIVCLYDVLFQSPKMTLVFEYCTCDLKRYMTDHPDLSRDTIRRFMRQLLVGLEYMHSKAVVHRDLKPQNLLIGVNNADGVAEIKIADFGLARVEGIPVKKYSHEAVTLWYRSPDVILGSCNYGLAVDMWSVGCIFAEMATGTPMFNGRTDAEQLQRMFRVLGSPTRERWPSLSLYPLTRSTFADNPALETTRYPPTAFDDYLNHTPVLRAKLGARGVELLRSMLEYEPSMRVTASNALQHAYFSGPDGGTMPPPPQAPHLVELPGQ
jgi:cyclin-dependent kinase